MVSYYWIKLYHEILDDPKMGRLPDRAWRRTIEIFLMAGELDCDGDLPSVADMAWRLRTSEEELLEDMQALAEIGILENSDGSWCVVNFAKRQAAVSDAERQKRHREKQRKAQYYDTDSITEAEQECHESVTICDTDIETEQECHESVTICDTDIDTDTDTDEEEERETEEDKILFCPLHPGKQLKLCRKGSDKWYAHRLADGSWCKPDLPPPKPDPRRYVKGELAEYIQS